MARASAKTKPPAKRGSSGATQTAIGAYLDLSKQRVQQFASEGVFVVGTDKRLDRDQCRIAYIKWLRGEGRASAKTSAEAALRTTRQREIEQRIARKAHRLVDREEHEGVLDEIIGIFVSGLIALPAQITRDRAERVRIEALCDGLRTRIADRAVQRRAEMKQTGATGATGGGEDA